MESILGRVRCPITAAIFYFWQRPEIANASRQYHKLVISAQRYYRTDRTICSYYDLSTLCLIGLAICFKYVICRMALFGQVICHYSYGNSINQKHHCYQCLSSVTHS